MSAMHRATVSKSFRFEAAHSLTKVAVGHKCARKHGHSYEVILSAEGPVNEAGMVIDYAEIEEVARPVIDRLDHWDLNEVWEGAGNRWPFMETTAENIAVWFLKRLPVWIRAVEVKETPIASVRMTREQLGE